VHIQNRNVKTDMNFAKYANYAYQMIYFVYMKSDNICKSV